MSIARLNQEVARRFHPTNGVGIELRHFSREHGIFMIDRNDCVRQGFLRMAVLGKMEQPGKWAGKRMESDLTGRSSLATGIGLAALCLFSLVGCGGQGVDGRYPLNGTVTFQGKPLDKGTIEFSTTDRSQLTGATIENGKYSVPAEQGLKPGKYTVRISATEEAATGGAPPPPGPENANQVAKERIPEAYNLDSKITVDVKESGANKFDFDIP